MIHRKTITIQHLFLLKLGPHLNTKVRSPDEWSSLFLSPLLTSFMMGVLLTTAMLHNFRGIHKLRWQARGRGGSPKCQRYLDKSCWTETINIKGLTALYIWFRGNFHIKKRAEVPIIDNYMEYLGCTFFVTDKLRYKIINYQYFKSISDMKIPAKSNIKGCQLFDLNVFRSAGVNLSTKRRGVKNPQNRENVIYECPLSTYIWTTPSSNESIKLILEQATIFWQAAF